MKELKFVPTINDSKIIKVDLVYGNEMLSWHMDTYNRTELDFPQAIFEKTNLWLAQLGAEDVERIWLSYVEISEIFNSGCDLLTAKTALIKSLEMLYHHVKVSPFLDWAYMRNLKNVPGEFRDELRPQDREELTYLRKDYIELMSLAELLRFVLPVWGTFIKLFQGETGTPHKEFEAVILIGLTDVVGSSPYDRLLPYIDAIIADDPMCMAAIDGGVGTSDALEYMTAQALVRKIAIGETVAGSKNIISRVSNHVRNAWIKMSKNFTTGNNRLVATTKPKDSDTEENTSVMEQGKVKQQYSEQTLAEAIYSLTHVKVTGSKAAPAVSKKLINLCINFVMTERPDITVGRQQLMGLAVHRATDPKLILEMSLSHQYTIMGIAMAVYIERHEYHIAALLTCYTEPVEASIIATGGLNLAISKESYLKLDAGYYSDRAGETSMPAKKMNPGFMMIQNVLNEYTGHEAIVRLPEEIVARSECEIENGVPLPSKFDYAGMLAQAHYDLT